ncbi:MAG: hypothetical protein ACLGJB_03760 [Blastocatellia bacterium]
MAANAETLPNHKVLYHIVKGNGRKSSWRKFGAGFINQDGSMNIIIDLFPGQHFQLRDYTPPAPEPVKAPAKTHKLDRTKKFTK